VRLLDYKPSWQRSCRKVTVTSTGAWHHDDYQISPGQKTSSRAFTLMLHLRRLNKVKLSEQVPYCSLVVLYLTLLKRGTAPAADRLIMDGNSQIKILNMPLIFARVLTSSAKW